MPAIILAALQAIPALLQLFKGVVSVIRQIQLLFRKRPVEQVIDDEKKHSEAQKKTETQDDTSGAFGG